MTHSNRYKDAHTVLLPAFDTTTLSDTVKHFLENGGCSLLLGESREEYVARNMTSQRKATETAEAFQALTQQARDLSDHLLIAVDQEIGGICRLHNLVPQFPDNSELADFGTEDFEKLSALIASMAKDLGVNCFLAPILDVVTGKNPWLEGRTWSEFPNEIARISSAYIRGIQSSGVAATAKHFPGHHKIPLDPAVEKDAVVKGSMKSLQSGFIPFTDAIKNEVEIIMTGPAVVSAFDDERPASLSPKVIGMLRNDFKFNGVVMSDGLDAPATRLDSSVAEAAVKALQAGSDLLLLGAQGDQLEVVTTAINAAVENGELAEERLHEAADKVRSLAKKYSD